MKHYAIILVILLLSICKQGGAATIYNFDTTYNGTSLTLEAGSEAIIGTNLLVGDTFIYTMTAAGNDFWTVDTAGSHFVSQLYVEDSGVRNGNAMSDYSLDGFSQMSNVYNVPQSYVHVGMQSETFAAGMMFDKLILTYTMNSSTATTTIFQSLGLMGDTRFRGWYTVNLAAPVPEPATVALLGIGLAGLAGAEVRRRRKKKAVENS